MIRQLFSCCCISVGLFWVSVFYFLSIICYPSLAYPFGVPCSSFDTFKPNTIFHGLGLGLAEIEGDLSDYEFRILDKNGVLVDFYNPNEVYTVQLRKRSGFFRGFLIQARIVQPISKSRENSVSVEKITHKRTGHFISDSTWLEQGIQYQSCEDDDQLDSVMHLNSRIKKKIGVQWKIDDATENIQFVLTIVESLNRYYDNWRPKSGKLNRKNESRLMIENRRSTIFNFWERRATVPLNERAFAIVETTSQSTPMQSTFITVPSSFNRSTSIERTAGQAIKTPEVMTDVSRNPCHSFPCYNNGSCLAISKENFTCYCTKEWIGSLCLDRNFCHGDPCINGGKCSNGDSYPICQCPLNYTGEFCQHFCPIDMCLNGGKCRVNGRNLYSCECKSGWTGARCQLNINECASNPCKIGQCIDRLNGYLCKCPPGLMGSRCHRPCEDIYNSCNIWKSEDSCSKFRQKSPFFDIHCAKSCEICSVDQASGFGVGETTDVVVSQGFLYAMAGEDSVKAVLHAASNEGFITMEEGTLIAGRILELVTTISMPFQDDSFLDASLKKNVTVNNYLRETIERFDVDDGKIIYANYYQLKESYKPF